MRSRRCILRGRRNCGGGSILRTDGRRLIGTAGIGFWTSDDDDVAGIIGDSPGFREKFDEAYLAVGLINHGMTYGADDSDGFALLISYGDAYFRVRDETVGNQDLFNFAFGLSFRQSGDMQPYRNEGNRDRTDRKSTRLNSSHLVISYAVFCLK